MTTVFIGDKIGRFLIKGLRFIGNTVRAIRRNTSTFDEACVSLSTENWSEAAHPDVYHGSAASDVIYEELLAKKPSMICRFGVTELASVVSATTPLTLSNAVRLVTGDEVVRDIGIHAGLVRSLCNLSGFFPPEKSDVRRFVELTVADMSEIDVLATWCYQEKRFKQELSSARKVRFRDLEPYMHDNPWSRVLAGKRVLVVHPFADTIEAQYGKKRSLLFSNPSILPEFDLITIKAVQSIANNKTPFVSWFEALEHMKSQIERADFDIAIIGCGAYGMPLAAHVKRLGKKSVHLGGQTQLLFGIRGKRWETGHEQIRMLFNEHWVYPSEQERPTNFTSIEGGAYW